jgi:type IV secretion system protein VirB10
VFAIALVCAVGGVVMYTIVERGADDGAGRGRGPAKVDPATSVGVFDEAPSAGLIEAREPPAPPPVAVGPVRPPRSVDRPQAPAPVASAPGDAQSYAAEWQAYRQQQQQVRSTRQQTAMSALTASPTVGDFAHARETSPAAAGQGMPSMDSSGALEAVAARMDRMAALADGSSGGAQDENRAAEKSAWLDSPPDAKDYLPTGRKPLLSPYEVKAGTVIPGVMIGGINSDLPGQIIGQVSENVWDTATGRHLLIPQGSRLLGTYSNEVTRGQSRVLVGWQRIIYPDGSSLDIEGMPGVDQAGAGGFRDKVNNHYRRVFGDALLMSLFAAGIQLSQPEAQVGGSYDSQQIVAASLGQQLGQAGMQITQRNLNIQPTLEIRPGYRFNVMVTRDFVVRPWEG